MSEQPNQPLDPQDIEAYLLGVLPDERVASLDQSLRDDAAALQQFAQAMQVMSLVRQEFAGQAEYQAAHQKEPLLEDFNALLKDLREREDAAQPIALPASYAEPEREARINPDKLTARDLASVGGYVLRKTLSSKSAIITGVGTLAAVLLLVLILFNPFASDTPIRQDIADNAPSDKPAESVEPILRDQAVATLTATHNAEWDSQTAEDPQPVEDLRRGSDLHPGQRLTLTAGFAEITTARGAVAILQAPATIELLDNNALRLHSGKLVGICETESSKGFVVRTPHMDITDLGTEFGVDASRFNTSVVNVFEGEVSVASSTIEGAQQSVLLKADQAVAFDRAGEARHVESDPLSFVRADEFDAIVNADTSPVHRWQAYTAQLKRDPDLLALYVFDGDDDRAVANNTATPRAERFHAQLGDGRDHTSPSRATDRFGRVVSALAFDRHQMQALYVPDWHQAGLLDALTVSCWFKLDDHAGDWPLLVTHWHDSRDDSVSCAFHLGVYNAARDSNIPDKGMGLQAHVSQTGDRQSKLGWDVKHEARDGGVISPSDDWVHVALTIQCGGGPIRLYKNGIEIDTNGATYKPAHLPIPKHPLVIGGKSTYRGMDRKDITDFAFSGFFQGEIDDVALIGRALTQDDIQDMYRAGVAELD